MFRVTSRRYSRVAKAVTKASAQAKRPKAKAKPGHCNGYRMSQLSKAVANARVRKHMVNEKKQWQCNLCSNTVKAASMRELSISRYGHIKRVHPSVPLDRFTDLRSYLGVVSTELDVPNPAWMRGYCHAFCCKGTQRTCRASPPSST